MFAVTGTDVRVSAVAQSSVMVVAVPLWQSLQQWLNQYIPACSQRASCCHGNMVPYSSGNSRGSGSRSWKSVCWMVSRIVVSFVRNVECSELVCFSVPSEGVDAADGLHQTDVISDYVDSLDVVFRSGHHICHSSTSVIWMSKTYSVLPFRGLIYICQWPDLVWFLW